MFAAGRTEIAGMSPLREPRIRSGSCSLPRRKRSGLACHDETGEPGSRTIFPAPSNLRDFAGIRECRNTRRSHRAAGTVREYTQNPDRANAGYMIDAVFGSRLLPLVLARGVWVD